MGHMCVKIDRVVTLNVSNVVTLFFHNNANQSWDADFIIIMIHDHTIFTNCELLVILSNF